MLQKDWYLDEDQIMIAQLRESSKHSCIACAGICHGIEKKDCPQVMRQLDPEYIRLREIELAKYEDS